jgi:hypothetical protein
LKAFGRWWFGYGSPVEMGVFRIAMGFLILANQIMVGVDFDAWFTEWGFVPLHANQLYLGEEPRFTILPGVTDARITGLFYLAVTIAAFTTCIGLWTRVSTIVLALGIISLHHRNALILHGGDLVIRMGAIYMALAPSGAACSVDRLIGLWKGKAPPVPAAVSLWPQRLVQFQVALVYFTTVWHKWFGTYWRDGTATWYPLHLNEFDRFWVPPFIEEGIMIPITTYGTLAVELAMATLVFFRPWRKWALLGGVGLHLFIEYAMNIPLFAFLMIATYLSFFEGEEVTGWAKRVGERLKRFALTVSLPTGLAFAEGPGRAIQAMDPFGWVTYRRGKEEGWRAEDAAGRPRNPFRASFQRSMGAWALFFFPGLWRGLLRRALVQEGEAATPGAWEAVASGKRRKGQ